VLDVDDVGPGGVLDGGWFAFVFAFGIMLVCESSVTDSLYVDIVRLGVGWTKGIV